MYDAIHIPAEALPTRGFYFLRHGETQYNLERRFQGAIDVPLNDNGLSQAQHAAVILQNRSFSRIVASPANRVLKTASFTAEATGLPMHVDTELMEFNVGSFEGRNIEEVKAQYGMQAGDSFLAILPDDAESWSAFVPRVCRSVRLWTDQYADETILIVAHGLVFSALCIALGLGHRSSGNAQPWLFAPNGQSWNVEALQPASG